MSSCRESPAPASRFCKDARRYVDQRRAEGPKAAVIACEGACVKGEVARVAANLLSYRLERERAVRICLGDALTADSGMRELVTAAPQVVAIEGCGLRCATRLLGERLPSLRVDAIVASELYEYDRSRCFEIMDMPEGELRGHAERVAAAIRASRFPGDDRAAPAPSSSRMMKGALRGGEPHGKVFRESASVDGVEVTRVTFAPGARWSTDVAPRAGTPSCAAPHVALVLSGTLRVRMDDGSEEEFSRDDVMLLPPGHDAWTVGDVPCVFVDFSHGYERYGAPSGERHG